MTEEKRMVAGSATSNFLGLLGGGVTSIQGPQLQQVIQCNAGVTNTSKCHTQLAKMSSEGKIPSHSQGVLFFQKLFFSKLFFFNSYM